jgi:hypothetical protein
MEPILDFVAEIARWASVALILWGGMLTLQQLFASEYPRARSLDATARAGDHAAAAGRARLAN